MPAWMIPAAIAGSSLLGSWFGANKQDSINQSQQDFSREMYNMQRGDNIADWNRMNEYNHPSNQMSRLREAGLNPNLVYGNGSAVQSAAPLKGAEAPKWDPKSVAFNPAGALAGGLNAYYDIQMREAQTDNLKTQNTVLLQDQLLKKSSTELNNLRAMREQLDLNRGTDLYGYSLEMYKQQVRKMTHEADDMYNRERISQSDAYVKENTFQSRIDSARLEPSQKAAQINQLVAQTKNSQLQSQFKELEIDLRKNGINPSDPIYFRVIGQLLSKFGLTIK